MRLRLTLTRRTPLGVETRHAFARVGRNDPCPCRSGRKLKHCCLGKAEGQESRAESRKPSTLSPPATRHSPPAPEP